MVDVIIQTVLDHGPGIKWTDIEGLSGVKQTLVENIIYPQDLLDPILNVIGLDDDELKQCANFFKEAT